MMADDLRDIPHSLQRTGDEALRMADKAERAAAEEPDPGRSADSSRRPQPRSGDLARRMTERAAIAESLGEDTGSR